MIDKVQEIRKGIEILKSQLIKGACASQVAMETRCKEEAYNEVLAILDSLQEESVNEGRDIFDNCLKSEEKFILPQKISGNIDCENCLYSSACALGDIQACIIDKPVSEDLNEAAEEWDESLYRSDAFKAGAKWKKDKMMQNTIDAHCFGFQGAALFSFRLPADNYLVGSEVKVIVIKK